MSMNLADIPIIPDSGKDLPMAYCLMFYEYQRALDSSWLSTVEALFEKFQHLPSNAIGNIGDKHSIGQYGRVRTRLAKFLDAEIGSDEPDIRIDSDHCFPEDGFFPCHMRVAWNTSIAGIRQGVIAVRSDHVRSLSAMVDAVSDLLFVRIGTAYAHAFEFPAAYGPSYYLSSIGTVRSGESSTANSMYTTRITQWRDNTWHHGKRPMMGYLREIYPINFITIEHLNYSLGEKKLHTYMESVGTVRKCEFGEDVYRWDVPEENIRDVRQELEQSGLILSSISA